MNLQILITAVVSKTDMSEMTLLQSVTPYYIPGNPRQNSAASKLGRCKSILSTGTSKIKSILLLQYLLEVSSGGKYSNTLLQ